MNRQQIESAEWDYEQQIEQANFELAQIGDSNECLRETECSAARASYYGAKKTGYNSFGKWHYFELADFLVPALKLFDQHGLCGTVTRDGQDMMLYVRELDGDGLIPFSIPLSSAELKGAHDIQNLGAVLTYSRRYLWTLALEILEHDAVDSAEPREPEKPVSKKLESGSAPKIEFNKLPESKQSSIRDMVLMLGEFTEAENYAGAYETLQAFGLNSDDKVALWSQLDSKTRSAFKRLGEAKNTGVGN